MKHNRSAICLAAQIFLAAPFAAPAQPADTAALDRQRTAMQRFAAMDGAWRGKAVISTPQGPLPIIQTERSGPLLGGSIRLVEGKGYDAGGKVRFNAFAVISFDPATQSYALRSYAEGRSGTFTIEPTADGYIWEIPAGSATIRYTTKIGDDKWHEVGDRILPGKPPVRFFEMTLERIADSAWPSAGGVGPK